MSIFVTMSNESTHPAAALASADPDAPILERIRAGETALYEVLIRRYNQRLFRVARAFLHDDSEAEDVMQEAYLKAFVALPRFQGRARFSTWLTRILINCALAHLRRSSRRREVTLELAEDGGPTGAGPAATPPEAEDFRLMREQFGRLIESTLEALPSRYRAVFIMREIEEMSVAETAAALGITAENTKVRLHRARRLLREGLKQRMPDITLYGFLGGRCDALTRRVMDRVAMTAAGGQPDFFPVWPTPRS